MIFKFVANEFGPRALADVWTLLRALGVEETSTLKIVEWKVGVVTLEATLSDRQELLIEVERLLLRLGGWRVEEMKVVRMKFLPGTFDPSEVSRALDDFAVVSTRVCQASEPVVEMKWKIGGEVELKITMEQIVYDDGFIKYYYVSRFNKLNAIIE